MLDSSEELVHMAAHARIGDIVGYMLENARGEVEQRPAIVIHNWNGTPAVDVETGETVVLDEGCLQLQVFTDGDGGDWNDGLPNVVWKTSVTYDPEKAPGTWHWLHRTWYWQHD